MDRGHTLKFLTEALARGYHIVVLIVDSDTIARDLQKTYKNHPQITHILSMQDLEYVDGTPYLDYTLLTIYKEIQYKIEFVNHRWLNDGMLSSNKFINALCWWNHIFDTFDISLVVCPDIEHGVTYDIPVHIAKYRNIPSFMTPCTFANDGVSLLFYNTYSYIPLIQSHLDVDKFKENMLFSLPDLTPPKQIPRSLWGKAKEIISKLAYKIGGQLLVEFLACLKNKSFIIKQHPGRFPVSFWHKLYSYIYMKKILKYYNTHTSTLSQDCNFILYTLHMEPEGKTAVTVPLQNQLTIIQMLHHALPKGWKLVIKDHPMQFKLNTCGMTYYLYNIKWWKSIEFYKELLKLPNVVLIDFNTPSKTLLDKAQAVATINGTIHLEATFRNKPCIVFGGKNVLLQSAENIVYVDNFQTLKKGIERLENDPTSFDVSNKIKGYLEFISLYSTNKHSKERAKTVFSSIESYLNQLPQDNQGA